MVWYFLFSINFSMFNFPSVKFPDATQVRVCSANPLIFNLSDLSIGLLAATPFDLRRGFRLTFEASRLVE